MYEPEIRVFFCDMDARSNVMQSACINDSSSWHIPLKTGDYIDILIVPLGFNFYETLSSSFYGNIQNWFKKSIPGLSKDDFQWKFTTNCPRVLSFFLKTQFDWDY